MCHEWAVTRKCAFTCELLSTASCQEREVKIWEIFIHLCETATHNPLIIQMGDYPSCDDIENELQRKTRSIN